MNSFITLLTEGRCFREGLKGLGPLPEKAGSVLDLAIHLAAIRLLFRGGRIQRDKVFVMTFDNSFSCNPKYIALELLKQSSPPDIVWAVDDNTDRSQFPEGIRLVRRGTAEMFREQSTARVWLDNARNCVWFGLPKKRGQVYINTWHGSMGIKRLSGDLSWRLRALRLNRLTDFVTTNSRFEEQVFRSEFWPRVRFKKYGHPRNDLLMNPEAAATAREKVFQSLNIPSSCRTILYAPTFRDNRSSDYLLPDFEAIREAASRRFGGSWVILARMHFRDRERLLIEADGKHIIDAGRYPDMQELMAAADIGITDYSSWAYDYILLKRPLLIYAPDLDDYADSKGFYYPLESTPFPIAKTPGELSEAIYSFDKKAYPKRVRAFLKDKGCYERGLAAKRTANLIGRITGT